MRNVPIHLILIVQCRLFQLLSISDLEDISSRYSSNFVYDAGNSINVSRVLVGGAGSNFIVSMTRTTVPHVALYYSIKVERRDRRGTSSTIRAHAGEFTLLVTIDVAYIRAISLSIIPARS